MELILNSGNAKNEQKEHQILTQRPSFYSFYELFPYFLLCFDRSFSNYMRNVYIFFPLLKYHLIKIVINPNKEENIDRFEMSNFVYYSDNNNNNNKSNPLYSSWLNSRICHIRFCAPFAFEFVILLNNSPVLISLLATRVSSVRRCSTGSFS